MIRVALVKVLDEYLRARELPLAGHPLSIFIRNEAPTMIRRAVSGRMCELPPDDSPERGTEDDGGNRCAGPAVTQEGMKDIARQG